MLLVAVALAAYVLGVVSHARNLWPLRHLKGLQAYVFAHLDGQSENARFDYVGRLLSIDGKTPVRCPSMSSRTGVLLAIGQSNAANHSEVRVRTRFPGNVSNYFGGRCYVAGSPLLGASGRDGEFITLIADRLVEAGLYRDVVIVSAGVSGSPISRWQAGADLSDSVVGVLHQLAPGLRVTEVVWHQGESDFRMGTAEQAYAQSFRSMIDALSGAGLAAPVFISVSTRCGLGKNWYPDNPTALAQQGLVNGSDVLMGINSDELFGVADRRDDCHFSASGQAKAADAYANAILRFRGKS